MRHGMLRQQKGITLSGVLIWSIVFMMFAVLGAKLTPAYLEHMEIQKTFAAIVSDSTFKNASPKDIRLSFNKRAIINDINVIKGQDIKISKNKGQTVLMADYSVTVPLIANISILIDFKATSG